EIGVPEGWEPEQGSQPGQHVTNLPGTAFVIWIPGQGERNGRRQAGVGVSVIGTPESDAAAPGANVGTAAAGGQPQAGGAPPTWGRRAGLSHRFRDPDTHRSPRGTCPGRSASRFLPMPVPFPARDPCMVHTSGRSDRPPTESADTHVPTGPSEPVPT